MGHASNATVDLPVLQLLQPTAQLNALECVSPGETSRIIASQLTGLWKVNHLVFRVARYAAIANRYTVYCRATLWMLLVHFTRGNTEEERGARQPGFKFQLYLLLAVDLGRVTLPLCHASLSPSERRG